MRRTSPMSFVQKICADVPATSSSRSKTAVSLKRLQKTATTQTSIRSLSAFTVTSSQTTNYNGKFSTLPNTHSKQYFGTKTTTTSCGDCHDNNININGGCSCLHHDFQPFQGTATSNILSSTVSRNATGRNSKKWFYPSTNNIQNHQYREFSSGNSGDGKNTNLEEAEEDSNGRNMMADATAQGPSDLGLPGAQKGGKKLAIVFTCNVCDTRSAKQFTENSYRNGVVIVQCPGCENRHLIADNLGFFSDEDGGWNIEKGMSKLGQNVKVVTNDDVLELSVEDVWGDLVTKVNDATITTTANTSSSEDKDDNDKSK